MPQNFSQLVGIFFKLIQSVIPLVAGLALLAFFWGLTKFIAKAGDEKAVAEGKNLMVWGLIALFVMVSIFGILRFFFSELGFGNSQIFGVPLLPPYGL